MSKAKHTAGLLAACKLTQQQLADFLAAIRDQGIEADFVDDATDMMGDGDNAVDAARAAITKVEGTSNE
jgi:hypothetical protein